MHIYLHKDDITAWTLNCNKLQVLEDKCNIKYERPEATLIVDVLNDLQT